MRTDMAEVGSVLHGMYGDYRLMALLAESQFARVFASNHPSEEVEVAVKVLKPNLPVATVRSFILEARHIAEVSTAVAKWISRQSPGDAMADLVASPLKLYELHEATGPNDLTFRVQESVHAKRLEKKVPVDEPTGLRIGIQLFGLFAVLHEEMRLTYTDFNFQNLWCQTNDQRLRVTDWGVRDEEFNPTNVRRDLERATHVLLLALTGTALTPGQRLHQQPRWESLSEGTQRLLAQALHPDPSRRPQSASEMRKELVRLAGYWQPERPARVLQRAELILNAVEGSMIGNGVDPASQQTLIQAVGMLSVLQCRRKQEAETEQWPPATVDELDLLWQRTQMLLPTGQTQIEKAQHMLDAGSTAVAQDLLRQAAQDFPDELAVHRWLALAEAVERHRPSNGEMAVLKQAVELCEQRQYPRAKERLATVAKIVPEALQQEIDFHLTWEAAIAPDRPIKDRIADFDQATGQLAALAQRSVDYANAVRLNAGTDVDGYGDTLRQEEIEQLRQQRVERFVARITEAIDLKNPTKVITVVEGEFKSFADDPRAVDVSLDLAQSCLGTRKYLDAGRVYAMGKDLTGEDVFRLGSQVSHACQELARYRASEKARAEVDDAITHLLDARADLPTFRLMSMQEALAQAIEDSIVAAAALKKNDAAKAMNDLDAFRAHLRAGQSQPLMARLQSVLAEAMQQDQQAARALVGSALGFSEQAAKILYNTQGLAEAKNEQEAQIALAKSLGVAAKYDVSVQIALATAAGMPGATSILEGLSATCDAAERRKLAVVYRGLADRLDPAKNLPVSADDDEQHRTVAVTGSPTTKPSPNANATSSERSSITVDSQLTAEDALQALQSNDPKLWQIATSKQPSEQAQWGAQARDLITQRTKTLLEHWRDMDRAFSLLATSPRTTTETIQKWERLYSITSCWDSRKSTWVPTGQLLREIIQISDTRQAEQWLKQAKDNVDRGKTPEAKDRIALALTQFPNASDEVLQRLRELQESLKPRPQSTGLGSSAESLENLLKRAVGKKRTLTELRKHLSGLSQTYPEFSDILLKQHDSLANWEQREQWLNEIEQKILSPSGEAKMLPTASDSQAANFYLTLLNALRNQPFWHDYVPWDAPVFAKIQQRLERITRSFDPNWKPELGSIDHEYSSGNKHVRRQSDGVPSASQPLGEPSQAATETVSPATISAPAVIESPNGRSSDASVPSLSEQDALKALQSDDPKRWETATTMPVSEQAQWSPQAKELASERRRTLIEHRRDMERAFSLFAASPTTAKETIQKWQRTFEIVSCWDPRENAWVPTDNLLREVAQIADTQQAEQSLRQAKDIAERGGTSEAMDRITHALYQFPNASNQVIGELSELLESLKSRLQSPGSNSSPDSVEYLLKRAVEEKRTLTDLRKHLSGLSRAYPEFSDIFFRQHNSLVPWEQRERWLNEVEQKILSTSGELKALPMAAEVQTAKGYLTFLNALRNQPCWSNYVPWDAPVFAKTQQRLERIVRTFDPKWKSEDPRDHEHPLSDKHVPRQSAELLPAQRTVGTLSSQAGGGRSASQHLGELNQLAVGTSSQATISAPTVIESPNGSTGDASVPPLSEEDALQALQSNDPKRWELAVTRPVGEQAQWSLQVKELLAERTKMLLEHRREMDRAFSLFEVTPDTSKETILRWQRNYAFISCWDSRNNAWVPTDQLLSEVASKSNTEKAERWLKEAKNYIERGRTQDAKNRIETALTEFPNASARVLRELRELQESLRLRPPGPGPDSNDPSLEYRLKRAVEDSATLTELRKHLADLIDTAPANSNIISQQYASLAGWEIREHWLSAVEKTAFSSKGDSKLLPSAEDRQTASNYLEFLRKLSNQAYWRNYVPVNAPVFAKTQQRLERIVRSFDPK